jgi:chromosomal replication initiator protein
VSVAAETSSPPALVDALVRRIGLPRYQLWFQPHAKFALNEAECVVAVPNAHFQDWLQSTFGDAVRESVRETAGEPLPVRFVIDRTADEEPAAERPAPKKSEPTPGKLFDAGPKAEPKAEKVATPARRWKLLADFVVGPCNRVAYASAVSVAEEPGQGANPLVLHGPVGTGKTHLLEGVYAALRKNWPDLRVLFVTAEDFTNRFVQTLRLGRQPSFRKQFRGAGALLLDDLHFLARKKGSQEEFLHTFDALVSDGRQVVVTCDCHPRLADEFMPELADRLLGGSVWGLTPPDADTRLAILRAKATPKGKPARGGETLVPDEVLAFLAKHLRGNVRELEGALTSVRHFGRVTGRRIDLALAREALGDLLRHAIRVVTLVDVDQAVCLVLRLPAGTLQSKQRAWAVSHPRMLATYLSRKHTAASYGDISRHFGNKSHSGAVAAEKKVRQWLEDGERLAFGERQWPVRELVERVERELQR